MGRLIRSLSFLPGRKQQSRIVLLGIKGVGTHPSPPVLQLLSVSLPPQATVTPFSPQPVKKPPPWAPVASPANSHITQSLLQGISRPPKASLTPTPSLLLFLNISLCFDRKLTRQPIHLNELINFSFIIHKSALRDCCWNNNDNVLWSLWKLLKYLCCTFCSWCKALPTLQGLTHHLPHRASSFSSLSNTKPHPQHSAPTPPPTIHFPSSLSLPPSALFAFILPFPLPQAPRWAPLILVLSLLTATSPKYNLSPYPDASNAPPTHPTTVWCRG